LGIARCICAGGLNAVRCCPCCGFILLHPFIEVFHFIIFNG
jgi:hypothetical protein